MAKNLKEMFSEQSNKLLLLFLHPILMELKSKTLLLQTNQRDPLKVFGNLKKYFLCLAAMVVKKSMLVNNNVDKLCTLNSSVRLLPAQRG